MDSAKHWIKQLKLQLHPEGGYYKETYRSSENIPADGLPKRFSGERTFSTAIYYLLEKPNFSAFHRIKQDEIWHFYDGSSLTIHVISPKGEYAALKLGKKIEKGESPQIVVPAGTYFAAEVNNKSSYTLSGCTVAPGFDFADFEMPSRDDLLNLFPNHQTIINTFTRQIVDPSI